jgi:hypothetical protein
MSAELLITPSLPRARCFVYTEISKYSPGMLFQEPRSNYSLWSVIWSNFAEYDVSVNYILNALCYVEIPNTRGM